MDELVDRFLLALEAKDLEALRALRVSQTQYLDIIVPGTVEKGRPPRQVTEKPKQFFWEMLDFKSGEFAKILSDRFGGRHYRSHAYEFTREAREYDWYKAHGELKILLEGEDQTVYRLQTGWVAEVGGRYKFIGYAWDD